MNAVIRACTLIVGAACGLAVPDSGTAQPYPVKPVRLIVPFPAGGGADIIARSLGQRLGQNLGQQIVVDNRTGASGLIGAELAARAPADGYTLVLGTSSNFSINPALVRKPPYDPAADFAPVTLIATAPLLLAVHPSLPARSVSQLVALARSRPGELLYASNGTGSLSHLATALFSASAGVRLTHVPYKGGTPAVIDTVSGQVQMIITAVPTLLAQVKAGRLRALAVTGNSRSAALPDLPTVSDAGVKGFAATQWYGLFAPKGTAGDIVDRMHQEVARAVRTPDVTSLLARDGSEAAGSPPAEFAAFLKSDIAKWSRVIRETGIRID